MPVNDYLVPLLTCTLTDAIIYLSGHRADMLLFIKHNHRHHRKVLGFFVSLLCCTLVSILVLGIGIARGQYYWVLDIGCLSWYHSNPTTNVQLLCHQSEWVC